MVSLGILQRFKIDLWMALKVKEQELPWDINYGCVCIVETDVGSALTAINQNGCCSHGLMKQVGTRKGQRRTHIF